MPFLNVAPIKIGFVCTAAALLAILTATAVLSAEARDRLPGSTVDLNEAIFRSDVIETAEFVSLGEKIGRVWFRGIELKPSVVHKGVAQSQESIPYSLTLWGKEATPGTGEEFIVFLSNRQILKVLPKTSENLQELGTKLQHPKDVLDDIDRRLAGSKLSFEEAVVRSDTVETTSVASYGFEQWAGACGMLSGITLEPSTTFKGNRTAENQGETGSHLSLVAKNGNSILDGYYMGITGHVVRPRPGEECIFFIAKRMIIKVSRTTEENVRAVKALTAVP